jgi:hypothetical protein
MDANGTPAGSGKVRILPGPAVVVPLKLKAKTLALLLRKKRLTIDVSYAVPDGLAPQNVKYNDKVVTLVAPKPKPKPKVAPKRK